MVAAENSAAPRAATGMANTFKIGDQVSWNSEAGRVSGTIIGVHSRNFEVNGYTDNVGGRRYNQRLSERRAKSVVDYLVAKGVEAARIKATGYGESHPAVPNNSEANRAKNRRIEFKVVK